MSPQSPAPDPLETVLRGLHDARPTADFQARLLARLEATPAAPAREIPNPFRTPARTRARLRSIAVALAATLLVAVFLAHPHTPQRAHQQTGVAPPAPPLRHLPPTGSSSTAASTRPRHPLPHRRPTLAEVEAAAPSLPPPPLQLTAEERNIQRFRSLHSAVSLAALSPAAISAQTAADQRALHDFFDPTHQEN